MICAFDSAHAVAHALKLAEAEPDRAILVGLSGRGDKDVSQAQALLGAGRAKTQAQELSR
jgi:tryptophan synthase beta chain